MEVRLWQITFYNRVDVNNPVLVDTMANEEHLKILKQGVDVWNQWREDNPEVTPNLTLSNLSGENLSDVKFSGAFLDGTDFSGAFLDRAELDLARLIRANLSGADLSKAELYLTNFYQAILSETKFYQAILGGTNLGDVDLSTSQGLESTYHESASSISIDTIYKSKGNISESFLRSAGVPESFITYMHSLTAKAFDYYSCFISYNENDELFSERLYNDLQAAEVRVWRWREDAPWGRSLMKSVDQAIRVYDKLIVICSESSLQAQPVIREIERALQKEDELARQGMEPEVLFPIRLDDYIFEGWEHHRKADVVTKNVGDFSNWDDPEAYKKALERLLKDLQGKG